MFNTSFADSTQVNIQAVQKLKNFAKLDERTKAYLLGDPNINSDKVKVLRAQLGFTSKAWMEYVDYAPDTDALAAAVGQTALQLQRDLNVLRLL